MKIKVKIYSDKYTAYNIIIGNDIFNNLSGIITDNFRANKYFVIIDTNVFRSYSKIIRKQLSNKNFISELIILPSGEKEKNIKNVLDISNSLLSKGADRKSAIIAIGGGVVGDIAGFISSIYMRGIPIIHIPTSLIAQVDSSIGGKTAIDIPKGKNILGSFNQPNLVLTDINFLKSLDESEYRNGLSEVVKYGIISGTGLFNKLERNINSIKKRDTKFLANIISTCVKIKKGIVEKDEKENNLRRILNFGHTIGHAIESASVYKVPHGRAVASGMIIASRISAELFGLKQNDLNRIEELINKLGLDYGIPEFVRTNDILNAIKNDKKKSGKIITFIMLRKIGLPLITNKIPTGILKKEIDKLRNSNIIKANLSRS
jgi:3-dehydroquinate synthase